MAIAPKVPWPTRWPARASSSSIVTTKLNGSNIDVFGVEANGRLTSAPVKNASQTPVPFSFTFAPNGTLVVGEAGASDVSTYTLNRDGSTTPVATQTDGQVALC